ncbi:MAG: Asd/ArgC dimerization domain-containing protein [Terriglobia bacterium]
MKPSQEGYRVAVVGASSLLGKELVSILEQGKFPVSRLVTFETDEEEPELPIIDLSVASAGVVEDGQVGEEELDFAFLSARLPQLPAFLDAWQKQGSASRCLVVDVMGEGLDHDGDSARAAAGNGDLVGIPFLDRRYPVAGVHSAAGRIHVSPHPAVIVISSLLLRLAARFPLKKAVAQVFSPASESGSRGVEELQRQTVNILSFQKIPDKVFGAQLSFNVLSRLGKSGKGEMPGLEARVRRQLNQYLGDRVPLPALRLLTVPVFYSVAVSLYVETAAPITTEGATAAVAGERIKVRPSKLDAPTQVEVTGSSDILVDSISADAEHPSGLWIWAVADNLHLAATNAVELAASLREQARA